MVLFFTTAIVFLDTSCLVYCVHVHICAVSVQPLLIVSILQYECHACRLVCEYFHCCENALNLV